MSKGKRIKDDGILLFVVYIVYPYYVLYFFFIFNSKIEKSNYYGRNMDQMCQQKITPIT
jgi:hypothetical protein